MRVPTKPSPGGRDDVTLAFPAQPLLRSIRGDAVIFSPCPNLHDHDGYRLRLDCNNSAVVDFLLIEGVRPLPVHGNVRAGDSNML